MSAFNGEVYFRGMTDSDWKRLHTRVIPNPVPLDEFKDVVLTGKLQDRYLAKDLHKMMQELRDLLREHGELREAAIFPLSGKKQELSQAAAAAVRVIDSHRDRLPALRRSPGSTTAASGPADVAAPQAREGSTSPTLDGASDAPLRLSGSGGEGRDVQGATTSHSGTRPTTTAATPIVSPRRSSRILPLTDHISPEKEQPLTSELPTTSLLSSMTPAATAAPTATPTTTPARLREPALSRDGSAERLANEATARAHGLASASTTAASSTTAAAGRLGYGRFSSTIGQHAATAPPPPPAPPSNASATSAAAAAAAAAGIASSPSSTAGPSPVSGGVHATVSVGAANELAQLNEAAPPFFRILNVARRFQLRFGSSPLKFEIPVQYTEAVNSRRLRVFLIPLRHPNIPARWPTAKEIVVYVNEQCVMTPWKRSWPDRKQEVAKTYLPLDITYLLSRNVPAQRMQVDVFNKEYLSPAIIAVVQPQTLEEVTESMLLTRLGCRGTGQVQQAFADAAPATSTRGAGGAPLPNLLLSNDAAVWQTYASILEEDEDEDGLEADDPVITTKCPISQLPLNIPVRGRRCSHLQCVDLDAFLVSSHKGAYWNCALCDAEMRPADVQVDTVLWRYLHGCGSPDRYPTYLRLSARPAPAQTTTPATAGAAGKYFWHPSTRTGEDADVVSDSESDAAESPSDDGGRRAAEAETNHMKRETQELGLPPPLQPPAPHGHMLYTRSATLSPRSSTATPSPLSSNNTSWASGREVSRQDRKRGRAEEEGGEAERAGDEEPQGTADDPIEL